ncbi:hypothetical protein SteCoe_27034 [Stentor coeruleus]|uniref:dual-specificity kinase n=1 Tax=Stentor coeruleus TaxID=5963 RepID=A0A1R2BBH3_9CILI|nr:hypothetical protein SteCoe_27034 [Stentor coeruleus]
MQNSLHRRFVDFQSSKLKRIADVPLCTIYESKGDLLGLPTESNSPQGTEPKRRDLSVVTDIHLTKMTIKDPQKLSPSSAMMLRTSSLSPARSSQIEDSCNKKKLRLPMSGTQAGLMYSEHLTQQEKHEIIKYQEVYYLGERAVKVEGNFKDSESRYKANIGDHLSFRYEIISILGKGTFGNVYKCYDHKRNLMVAVKVMRDMQVIKDQAEIEIENLEKINDSDPDDTKCIVKMRQCFDFRDHVCICFELLSISLYHFLKINGFRGISKSLLKRIAVQVLIGLRHMHALGFIHCDLKPENILLKHENKSSIKIIDFGSATYKCASYSSYIQSRYYRAPEVILGCGYTNKIDIWSFGCILYELYYGEPLFTGESERDQLIKIMHVIGVPPDGVLKKSKRKNEFFHGKEPIIVPDSRGGLYYPEQRSLSEVVEEADFCDFLKNCFEWDPEMRFSAEEALRHPWIKSGPKSERGREWYKNFN